jgi:hypothetical protein
MYCPEGLDPLEANLGISMWATEIIPSLVENENDSQIIKGEKFDGYQGLGNEYDSSYKGDAIFISLQHRNICYLEISIIHVWSKGWMWSVKTNKLPNPPFLISNRLALDIVFNGYVKLTSTEFFQDTIEQEDDFFEAAVIVNGEDFGLLTVTPESIHLLVFSEPEKQLQVQGANLQFAGSRYILGQVEVIAE